MLRTNVKPGDWAECDTRCFEGIMLMVVDFIEDEKKNSWGGLDRDTFKPWEVEEYEKQQRGEPNQIDGEPDNEYSGMPEHQWKSMLAVWEVYNWYKGRYVLLEEEVKSIYDSITYDHTKSFMEHFAEKDEEKSKKYLKINEIEKVIAEEKKQNMIKIIEVVDCMWT